MFCYKNKSLKMNYCLRSQISMLLRTLAKCSLKLFRRGCESSIKTAETKAFSSKQ